MILAKSFGLFCQQIGARPFADGRIEPFSRDHDNNGEFGLGAVVNVETDTVKVSVGQRASLDLSTVASGYVALYRVTDTRNDYLVKSSELDVDMLRSDNSWIVTFGRVADCKDVWIACSLTTVDGKSYGSIAPCVTDTSRKSVKPILGHVYQQGFNTPHSPKDTAPAKVFVLNDEALGILAHLKFDQPKPIVKGDGSLAYVGGGNRYLPTASGVVLQQQNQAPWSMLGPCWIEQQSGNIFDQFGLHNTCWSWTSTGKPEVVEAFFSLFSLNERMVSFNINETEGINQTWELSFSKVAWTGESLSASAFVSVMSEDALSGAEIGLKLFNDDGSLREERWSTIKTNKTLAVQGTSFFLKQTDMAVPGQAQLCVRLKGLARGYSPRVSVAFPQIEASSIPTSRCVSIKQADKVVYTNNARFYPDYGRIEVQFSPIYDEFPRAAGHQLLLDTRDQSGRNGVWIVHKANGLIEFGTSDNLGAVSIQSASTIPLRASTKYTLVARWNAETKNMRLDLDGIKLVEKTLATMTNTQVMNTYRFGTRYDGQHRGSFQLHEFKHEQLDDDNA